MDERPAREGDPTATGNSSRAPWLLLLGAAVGLGLASAGLLESRQEAGVLPKGAAATVGDRTIRRVDYERVVAGVAGDLRGPVDEALRRRVLDRMIDEELLVQRALDLGLAVVDRRVRGELTSGLIDSISAEADTRAPTEAEVAAHYAEKVDFFARPGRIRARTLYFSGARGDADPRGPAAERARQARERLAAGESAEAVETALADSQVSPLPNAPLPASKIRDYVGPTVLAAIDALEAGEWSPPIPGPGGGVHLATVLAREGRVVPPFSEIEGLVREDLRRRRGDEALRAYLDDLRATTPIAVDEAVYAVPTPAKGTETAPGADASG